VKLLAIETSTEACSAALLVDGEVIELYEVAPRRHASLILPMCQQLLAEGGMDVGDLEMLAFGRGPGSFTGVRIAVSIIQGVAFAADLPVMPVSGLVALAQGVRRELGSQRVLAAIDARMGEVYWSSCVSNEEGIMQPVDEEQLATPEKLLLPAGSGWLGAGTGWQGHGESLRQRLRGRLEESHPERYPRARDIAILASHAIERGAEPLRADGIQPVYLRNDVTD